MSKRKSIPSQMSRKDAAKLTADINAKAAEIANLKRQLKNIKP